MGEQVSDSAAATPASTTASAVSTAPTTTASSLVTYKDAGCWGDGFYALCSGYKLDTSGDVVHPGASSCSNSCCDTVQHGGGGDAACWYGNTVFELCCEQVSDSAAATPASTTASAVSMPSDVTASSLVTYKDAGCWGDGFYALCSGYKLDTSGDVVHPGASSCSNSCCDTVQHGGG